MSTDQQDRERRSDLAVMDANEFKQKRRLESILDAHDNVEERANEAWDLFVAGHIGADGRNIMIQRAVKQAIRESYKLLVDHQREASEDVGSHSEYWVGAADDPIGTIQYGDTEAVIYGLRDFLETPEFFEFSRETTDSPTNKPPTTKTETARTSVPEQVSLRAFYRLKEFLDDQHDLEIAFEELDNNLADEEPTTVEIDHEKDLKNVDSLSDFGGPVDDRAVVSDDD